MALAVARRSSVIVALFFALHRALTSSHRENGALSCHTSAVTEVKDQRENVCVCVCCTFPPIVLFSHITHISTVSIDMTQAAKTQ